ncbi:MAG: hypothetical protein IPL12_22745 [Bacteroidetes bacterium]|nr:hypothetical protein [Bacteroidota bacterium]
MLPIFGYVKTVAPSEKHGPLTNLLFSKVLGGAGLFGDLHHSKIIDLNDTSTRVAPTFRNFSNLVPIPSVFHGCKSCHGDNMNGKKHGSISPRNQILPKVAISENGRSSNFKRHYVREPYPKVNRWIEICTLEVQ